MSKNYCWLVAVIAFFAAGCMESSTVINVKKDGSGTIEETTVLTKSGMQQLLQMAAMQKAAGAPKNPFMDKAKSEAKAKSMGATLDSLTEIKKADGRLGSVAKFSFKDISKLKFVMGDSKGPKEDKSFTFKLDKDTLTVIMPKEADGDNPAAKSEFTQMAEMPEPMKAMFDGMHISVKLTVDGKISKNSATHANKDGATLIDMDMGKLLKDKELLKKIDAAMKLKDKKKAAESIKDSPDYAKIEAQESFEIKFK